MLMPIIIMCKELSDDLVDIESLLMTAVNRRYLMKKVSAIYILFMCIPACFISQHPHTVCTLDWLLVSLPQHIRLVWGDPRIGMGSGGSGIGLGRVVPDGELHPQELHPLTEWHTSEEGLCTWYQDSCWGVQGELYRTILIEPCNYGIHVEYDSTLYLSFSNQVQWKLCMDM